MDLAGSVELYKMTSPLPTMLAGNASLRFQFVLSNTQPMSSDTLTSNSADVFVLCVDKSK
jgi:hypothetical protein